jgi:DNA-binding transcriptional ArsR family regulator
MSAILARFGRVKRRIRAMATKGVGGVKAVKAAPTAGSNGAPAVARVTPLPAKVIRNLAALGEPRRLAVLGFVAAATGPVTLAEIEEHLGTQHLMGGGAAATLAVSWFKQHDWLASERVAKGGGGGWRYRLSDAGRERLLALVG